MGEACSPGNGVSFMGFSKRQAITAAAWLVALLLCSISLVPAARSAFHSRPASQSRARRLEVPKHTTHALNQLPSRYGSPQGFQRKLTRADLLIAIPAEVSRLPLVASSRGWRRGVPTFITIDQPVTPELIASQPIMKEGMDLYNETYGYSENSGVGLHHKAGDRRATLTPFIANHSMGLDTFKWLLFGDDDIIFFVENTLNMLETMDHTVPYILSDHIWYPHWPAGSTEHHLHANRLAPRCLPCGYNDPLAPSYQHVPYQFDSQPECFCDHYALCRGDQHGLFDHGDCHWTSYGPGFWYFPHGGAGMIFSWDLFRGNTLEGVTGWVNGRWDISSGDSMICALIRDNFWILPTDPGYGYYRPNIRLFDPGWKGPQMKGPEDETVLAEDNGNDPLGLVYRLQTAIVDGSCHDECEDQLQHVLTTHLRTRYMTHEVDMGEVEIAVGKHNGTGEDHRIAMYLHHKMTRLMNQYDSMRQGRTWFNELSRNQTGTF